MSELDVEHPDDPRMIGEYRPFSFLSLGVLLLAVISVIALVNRHLIPFPIIVALLSLGAVLSVELSETRPFGGFLGYLALFLSTTVGAATFSYDQFHERHLFQLARTYAEQWLEKVKAGEIHVPFELTQEISDRLPDETDLIKHYRELNDGTELKFEAYKKIEPELSIRRAGQNCEFEFVSEQGHDENLLLNDFLVLQYRIKWKGPSRVDGQPFDDVAADRKSGDWLVGITMRRVDCLPPLGPQWIFKSIDCIEPKIERKLPVITFDE